MNLAPGGSHFLDTSAIIALIRQEVSATSEALVPFAAMGELLTGVYRSTNPAREMARMRDAIGGNPVIYPGEQTVAIYGEINAKLQRIGRKIPINDLWNAALAVEWNLPLLADDVHFGRVPGLWVLPVR